VPLQLPACRIDNGIKFSVSLIPQLPMFIIGKNGSQYWMLTVRMSEILESVYIVNDQRVKEDRCWRLHDGDRIVFYLAQFCAHDEKSRFRTVNMDIVVGRK
jgi:hypothetical protein